MKYGTLVDGKLILAPNPLRVEGYDIYNPTDEQYANAGYLPVVETPYPEIGEDEEPQYYEESWVEQDGQIVRVWVETDPPEPAPDPFYPVWEDIDNSYQEGVNAV